jgi:hypothetical protein
LGVDTAIFRAEGGIEFFPLVHGVTNAYHVWRFDPLAGAIFSSFGFVGVAVFLHLITFAGIALLLWTLKFSLFESICLGIVSVLLTQPIAVGFDTIILGALAWVPSCLVVLVLGFNQGFRRVHYFSLALLSVLLAFSANQVALLFMLGFAFYAWERARYLHPRLKYELLFILLIPAAVSAFLIPGPFFERYQPFSHFVPSYNTGQGRYGLLGPEIQFPVIDIGAVREAFNYLFIYLAAGLLLFVAWASSNVTTKRVIFGLMALLGSLAWLALTGPHTSQISPIAAINRMLPGLSLVSLAPILFVLAGTTFFIILAFFLSPRSRAFYILGLSFLCCYSAGFAPLVWDMKKFQHIFSRTKVGPELVSLKDSQRVFTELSPEDQRAIVSPGLFLIRRYGLESSKHFIDDKNLIFKDLEDFAPAVITANSTPDILNLIDRDLNTRATVGRTPQKGADWLLIRVPDPLDINGLWLRSDGFTSDYPRALEIKVASDCHLESLKTNPDFSQFRAVINYKPWEGAIKVSPSGVPYFGPIIDVKVSFETQKQIRCILARHIFPESLYDWSVTSVQLAFLREEPAR